ncbi:MAG TPA: thiamine pyrophosphate-dependent enzyme, partial [Thermomicrobiales bacterium]|nr:thiamine pyrophosphate-dependent enzyme [Thermomicrobiales bacterium]
IFLCENNLYAMGTAWEYVSAVQQMSTKAKAYDITAEIVDGQDVLAMYEVTKRAVEHCKSGKGPYFIEAMTYRFRGHSMADPETYREKDEVEERRSDDPIILFRDQLLEFNKAEQAEMDAIDQAIEDEIERAIQFADESSFPDPSTIYDHVYGE